MKKILIPIIALVLILGGLVTYLFVQKVMALQDEKEHSQGLKTSDLEDETEATTEVDEDEVDDATESSTESSQKIPQIEMTLIDDFKQHLTGETVAFKDEKGQINTSTLTDENLILVEFKEMISNSDTEIIAHYNTISRHEAGVIKGEITATYTYENQTWQRVEGLQNTATLELISASSYLDSQTDVLSLAISSSEASSVRTPLKPNVYEASNVHDRDLKTAWVEGASDDGVGEYIRLYLDGTHQVSFLKIHSGYHKSETLYAENHRPATVNISGGNGESLSYTFTDEMAETVIYLGAWTTDYIQINIVSTYPGDELMDTCISEISVLGK